MRTVKSLFALIRVFVAAVAGVSIMFINICDGDILFSCTFYKKCQAISITLYGLLKGEMSVHYCR